MRGELELNRRHWDEATRHHIRANVYGTDDFRAGSCRLHRVEVDEVGSVAQQRLLHLQCHLGLDTLSCFRGMTLSAPHSTSERVVCLDALRGVALFGVLCVNLVTEFRVSLFEQFLPQPAAASAASGLVASAIRFGLEFKAFILFSLLFGIGLEVQRQRCRARGEPFGRYVVRRLGFLLAVGLVHLFLIWNGDILTLYALTGLLGAALLALPGRVLLALALGLFVVYVLPLPFPSPFPNSAALRAHVEAAGNVYAHGSFMQVLAFRIHELRPISALLLGSVPRTLGLFLLGACAFRSGLADRGRGRGVLVVVAALGLSAGLFVPLSQQWDVKAWRGVITDWGALALALGYASVVVLAFDSRSGARLLSVFAPLGQLAFTSYLTQSVVLSVLFYGWGFGLFGRLNEVQGASLSVVLFGAQAVFAAWWLRRYRFGPLEWVWRSFTYGALLPLKRAL